MPLLGPGATFPALPLTPPGQPALTLPDAFAGDFAVVLFFRGSWCPYCNAQLRGFQRASASLAETGIKVAALSVDDEPTTAGLIAKHGLTFPVGHSADARAIAGHKSGEIEAILGYRGRDEIIHRDELVVP